MQFSIPLFDLNFDKTEEDAAVDVIRSKWISSGPKCNEFELKFCEMLGAKHAVALANCTVALHLAMKLCEVAENDEVICPSLTFVATVNAIRYVGAIPVFVDIKNSNDLTIDPTEIEIKITPRTKAIVVMHYGGFSCDMSSIMKIATKYNLKVIEDACHAPLSEYQGKKLGTIGTVGCFSFFSNKNISTGEGGMLVTNSRELFEKAKLLRSHGMTSLSYERARGHSSEYDVVELGFNYRMDDIRAAIGLVQLDKLKDDLLHRATIRGWYIKNLINCMYFIIPFVNYSEFTSNYIFPIIVQEGTKEKRDYIRKKLAEKGIQTSVHYPAVHRFSIYQNYYAYLPHTDYVSDNLITLPMYSKLTYRQVEYITSSLKKIASYE